MESLKHEEQRRHPRKSCGLPVDGLAWNSAFKALARNISIGGVFIETRKRFAIDEEIVLIFKLPEHQERIKVVGKIVWNIPGGLGIAFEKVPDRLATMVESFA
jgi:Tfp pilus assembly protein PilZ